MQAKAAFESLSIACNPDFHGRIVQSLAQDDVYCNLRSEMCMRIANVIPKYESKIERMCEMWMIIKGPNHDHPVPVCGHLEAMSIMDFGIEHEHLERMDYSSFHR